MRETPPKNASAKIFSFTAVLAALFLLGTVGLDVPYKAAFEIGAFVLLIVGFELLFRYAMTTYTYLLEENSFAVLKTFGNKQTYVCNLDLQTGEALIPTPRTKEEKEAAVTQFGTATVRYSYCQVIFPKGTYSYRFEFNGKSAEIIFQPSETFVAAMRAALARVSNEEAGE